LTAENRCLVCRYRRAQPPASAFPTPRLSLSCIHRPPPFVVSRFGGLRSFYIRHFSSLDSVMYRTTRILINTGLCFLTPCDGWSGAHAVGPGPGGTPSRGRSRRNRRRKPSCTSRRRWAEEAGSAGRSRRSLCRRCSLRTRRRAAVVAEGVGGVETRPLARPPKGTQKKSLDAAVA